MLNRKKLFTCIFLLYGLCLSSLSFVSAQSNDIGDSTLKVSNPFDNPNLAVRIPGLNFRKTVCTATECSTPWLADYTSALYKYGIGVIGILAVVTMMIGGIVWLTAGGNSERVSEARTWIGGSIIGIFIALTSYLILNFVNPALTQLSPVKISYIKKIDLPELLDPEDLTDQYTNNSLPKTNLGTGAGQYKVPILYQGRFKNYDKGYGKCGCGPTALTMVLNFYGINKTVPEIADEAKSNGNWEGGSDSNCGGWRGGMGGFTQILDKYNLKSKTGDSFDDIKNLLTYGPVIASITNSGGNCSFTCHGHYVVFTDFKNGNFYTNDPNEGNLDGNKCGGKPTNIISEADAKNGCSINAGVITVYR